MEDITPNPNMKDLEASKLPDEKTPVSIASGAASPMQYEEPYLGSTQQHAFTLPANLSYWSKIYDKSQYEGRHRFDPLFQWTSSEENKLVREVLPLLSSTLLHGDAEE
jgi:hypothetical protein